MILKVRQCTETRVPPIMETNGSSRSIDRLTFPGEDSHVEPCAETRSAKKTKNTGEFQAAVSCFTPRPKPDDRGYPSGRSGG